MEQNYYIRKASEYLGKKEIYKKLQILKVDIIRDEKKKNTTKKITSQNHTLQQKPYQRNKHLGRKGRLICHFKKIITLNSL